MAIDEISLGGKVAIVAGGGGRGIGGATSTLLARAGAAVAVADIDAEKAQFPADVITKAGGRALPIVADLREAERCREVVERTLETFGGVDILVNVAGGMNVFGRWGRMVDWTEEEWDNIFALNLRYVFLLSREVITTMREQERGGAVVNITSISGTVAAPLHAAYGAAKAGLINLTRTLSLEHARDGIRVNAVSPGSIQTPAAAASEERTRAHESAVPMGRLGEPQEIAGAVLFLVSDLAAYVTGQELLVDGGASARLPVPLGGKRTYLSG